MARIFITGSSQGLGLMAGQLLIAHGHAVVLHGRDSRAGRRRARGGARRGGAVVGDLSGLAGMRAVAEQADAHRSLSTR